MPMVGILLILLKIAGLAGFSRVETFCFLSPLTLPRLLRRMSLPAAGWCK